MLGGGWSPNPTLPVVDPYILAAWLPEALGRPRGIQECFRTSVVATPPFQSGHTHIPPELFPT